MAHTVYENSWLSQNQGNQSESGVGYSQNPQANAYNTFDDMPVKPMYSNGGQQFQPNNGLNN